MTTEEMERIARDLVAANVWEGPEIERAVSVLAEVPALVARIRELEAEIHERDQAAMERDR